MRKSFIYTTFLIICALFSALNSYSQTVVVGSGSYTTVLPPADAAGRNVNPTGTPRVSGNATSKPIATSDWWTGLLTFDGANLYNYPMSLRAVSTGLVVSYTFMGQGADDTRQPMSGDQPLLVGVTGLAATYPTVSDYSDWTVTAAWASGTHTLNATIGMGMPFVYFTKGSSDVASVTVSMGTVSVQNEMILVTNSLSGSNFAVYAPSGSTWTQNGTTYTSTLAGKNYFSAVMLPTGVAAATAAADYKQYAYVFPVNPSVTWSYDNATSIARSTFTVTADKKEGTGSTVLLGLLPHQWAHLASSSAQPGSYYYNTVRGTMKMLASNTFVVENKFKGILPTLPNTAKNSSSFDPGAMATKIDQVKGDGLQTWTDSYNDGLAMNRLIQVARIADQNGNTAARDQIISTVKTRLENWFKADAGENAFLFYYNSTWSTLIGYPAGYYSDANLNDHHFHYGYFISAAAAVEQFQPGWAAQWGGMVNLLVKDAANWDKTDTKYPFLRNFNPYAGHSFACGLLNNEPHGNNQESSSEAMNFNASLINWGTVTGNTAIRDLGIYLYTTEQTAIDEYYFNVNNRNFSATYGHPIASRVWGNGYDRGTFWTNDIAATYGIEMVPLTAASTYLGQNTTYVTKLWNEMKTKTGVLSNVANDNLWYDVYWSYLAFIDPATAITLYNNFPAHPIKNGESDANTYNWLHAFNGAGQLDGTVTANYPIAAVFNKAGNKTYVAHNYGASAITVTYSDGFTMSVPARTMKTNKDIDATATLTSSASQIPTNGTITLTATVGGTVSKVEFYNGTTLLGSKTAAPYTLTTAALPAGKPNFYVKAYNGTSFNLSNVVKVLVGSQLPYGGTKWAVPGTIEAGNFDYFEGGVGQDVSYFDTDIANQAGSFRSPEYVDAGATTGEGNTAGWINDGEWLEYSVNVTTGGTYDLGIRYTSGNTAGGGPFHIEVDGTTIASNVSVGFTSTDWSVWATKTVSGVSIPAGAHVIKMAFDKGGFNMGKTTFTLTGGNVAVTGVSINPTTATLNVGANQQLTATVAPTNATNKTVSWTSSNTAVVTVSASGLVSAIASGTATITVTTQDGNKTATSTITVVAANVPVTGVTVTPTTASIVAGATQQLTATVAPTNATNKNVTWTSSNTAVATVSTSGLVTGVAAGTATITVTTADGAKTATCAVTVTAANVAVTGVSMSPTTASIAVGATSQLTATIAPTNATNKNVTWSSSNTSVATVSSTGIVTGVSAGSATITVTTTDGSKTATCAVTVTAVVTTNLALNKATTTSTVEAAGYEGNLAVDGNATSTRWSSVFADPQWIYVDLGATYNVNQVKITWEAAYGANYLIQISADASNWTTMKTITSNTTLVNNHTGLTGAGRYVRIYGTTRGTVYGYSIFELEVYGTTGTNVSVTGVTMSPTSATITAGGTQQLTATVAPTNATNKTVTYASSNTAVASVNASGLITAVAAGTATITVTTQDGSKTATCAVTVNAATIAVTGVTMSPTSASIVAGATQQLTGTIAPTNATNKAVTWASSNTAIATVNSAGLVTAIAAGTATITVTTQDGSKTATCAVTVTPVSTTCSVTASTGDFKVNVSSDASNPTLTFVPITSGAGSSVCILYYNTSATGTFPGYMVTPNTAYRITAAAGATINFYYTYSTVASGEKSTVNTKNNFTVGSCSTLKSAQETTDVAESNGNEFKAFPSPMTNNLTLQFAENKYNKVFIYDMNGKVLLSQMLSGSESEINLNVSKLAKGVYYVTMQGNNNKISKLIVK